MASIEATGLAYQGRRSAPRRAATLPVTPGPETTPWPAAARVVVMAGLGGGAWLLVGAAARLL